ncbi:hypothetical protein Tco_1143949 [Tanacetum coccineum]
MAAPGSSNVLARRVIDDLLDFSGETSLEAMGDQDEVFDSLMCLRDDIQDENTKLMGLNDVIAEAEEKIAMKEEHVKTMEAAILETGRFELLLLLAGLCSYGCGNLEMGQLLSLWLLFFLLDKLAEVAGSSRLQDRMNLVFSGARSEDESFIELMRDLCFGFRIRLNKNRRLIAELEALGQWGDALRCLDYLREMVVRDFGTLEVLEQLLAGAHVRMRLKDGYVADMQQME